MSGVVHEVNIRLQRVIFLQSVALFVPQLGQGNKPQPEQFVQKYNTSNVLLIFHIFLTS